MFDVQTSIKVDPTSPLPYQVLVKIDVQDDQFFQKLSTLSITRNIRIGCKRKNSLFSAFSIDSLVVKIIEDDEKDMNLGYLENYIMSGHVFGFREEIEAEEFSTKAHNELHKFIQSVQVEFNTASRSRYFESENKAT